MSKYYYNKDYFQQIDTPEKAYWLGFLYADGCITRLYKNEKLKSMSVELALCDEDKEHLEKFRNALESNIEIHTKTVKTQSKNYVANRINVCCTKMCYDLIALGCTPCKTYDVRLPSDQLVPRQYKRDFIRGFFDGDGCINVTTMNGKPHILVTFTGMDAMLNDIASFLIDEEIITVYPKVHHDKRSQASSIYIYGDNTKDFLDYIYQDAVLYLDRKYQKYVDYYKDYQLTRHGVYWSNNNNAYVATICINDKHVFLGQSKSLEEAIRMRREAEIEKMNIKRKLPA